MAQTFCGTPFYSAPEVLLGNPYTSSSEIWSLGCIIYEIMIGFLPFMGENYVDLLKNLKKGTYFIPKSANISQEAINLIESCL